MASWIYKFPFNIVFKNTHSSIKNECATSQHALCLEKLKEVNKTNIIKINPSTICPLVAFTLNHPDSEPSNAESFTEFSKLIQTPNLFFSFSSQNDKPNTEHTFLFILMQPI